MKGEIGGDTRGDLVQKKAARLVAASVRLGLSTARRQCPPAMTNFFCGVP